MFAKTQRLSRTDFSLLLKQGRRLTSRNFTLVVPKYGSTEPYSGYAVVVSKKVARLSASRHRLKRRVTAILRTAALPKALVLYPRVSAATLTAAHMKEELGELLSKIAT